MSRYNVHLVSAEANRTRDQLRRLANGINDMCSGTMRLALHLSDIEYASLLQQNPDTLGHPDEQIAETYWQRFLSSPEAAVFRVQKV